MSYFNWTEKPPTLKAILESIVNFDNPTPVGLSKLAKLGRNKIFSFDYDLDESLFSREDFEVNILNHFIKRRIGFETVGAFKLELEVKINEILPQINMLIKTYSELVTYGLTNRVIRDKTETNNYNKNTTGSSSSDTTLDNKYSKLPQSRIQDIKDESYVSDYTLNNTNNTSNSNLTDESNDNLSLHEVVDRINGDEVLKSLKMIEETKNIYSLVFDELECLFYNLV